MEERGLEMMKSPFKVVRKMMHSSQADCLVIKDEITIRYLTGFTGDAGLLYIDGDDAVLVTDGRFTEQAKNEVSGCRVMEYHDKIWLTINQLAKGKKACGFDGKHYSYSDFNELRRHLPEFCLVNLDFEQIRMVKDGGELEKLRKAAQIADAAFLKILPGLHVGQTELEVAAKLEYEMRLLGSEKVSFDTIVVSGSRSSLCHGGPSAKSLAKGDFVTFDFGAVYCGYHSDMTRTLVMGKAAPWQREVYQAVGDAQCLGIASAKIGMTGAELDALVRKKLSEAGYEKYFVHGLGHGVGLRIHEEPSINKIGNKPLAEKMVFTVEPGVYIPGKGGVRIEDTVIMGVNGAVPINSVTKELLEIP